VPFAGLDSCAQFIGMDYSATPGPIVALADFRVAWKRMLADWRRLEARRSWMVIRGCLD
jgi:hypothetical protein